MCSEGESQAPVLNLDHYLLQFNNKLDNMNNKLEVLEASQQQTAREISNLQTSLSFKLDSLTATAAHLSSDHQQIIDSMPDVECMDIQQTLQLHQNMQDNITHQLETIKYYLNCPSEYTCGGTGGWRLLSI